MFSEIILSTNNKNEVIDITSSVREIIEKSGINEGICNVYTPHATAAVIINENYDPEIGNDFLEEMAGLVKEGVWRHDRIDGNGASHIKSSMIGPSETIPVHDGKLMLGTWQSIMFVDFDGPRKSRKIYITILGGK